MATTHLPLLDEVIAAHGGIERWAAVRHLTLQVRLSGNILALRFQSPRIRSWTVRVDTQQIHIVLDPFPRPGLIGCFDGQHLRIESGDGAHLQAQRRVRWSTNGTITRRVIWDDLDALYFFSYALWNYAVTPFLFRWTGFDCREDRPLRRRNGGSLRCLRVVYPPRFPTHCREQRFYFDDAGLLRRIDYSADVFGPWARAVHECGVHQTFDGLVFPTHRIVFARVGSQHALRLFSLMEGWVDHVAAE